MIPSNPKFSKRILRLSLFFLILIWCIGFLTPVLFNENNFVVLTYPFTKRIYSIVCHQLSQKTFTVNGEKLLVCARCTGIYLGTLTASFISIFYFPDEIKGINLFLASLIPMLADVLLTSAGVYHYSKYLAMSTGLFFGSVSFVYILNVVENNFLIRSNGN
ncbi:MAG: DUF2085 domain-containing protein [Ignavibacteriaceae bacterium]